VRNVVRVQRSAQTARDNPEEDDAGDKRGAITPQPPQREPIRPCARLDAELLARGVGRRDEELLTGGDWRLYLVSLQVE
jgi:hypothetical protein